MREIELRGVGRRRLGGRLRWRRLVEIGLERAE